MTAPETFFNKYLTKFFIAPIVVLLMLTQGNSALYAQSIPLCYDDHTFTSPEASVAIYPTLNDSIYCSNPTINIIVPPAHGSTNLENNTGNGEILPSVIYTPLQESPAGSQFIGIDSILISVCCNGPCDTSWIYITVTTLPDNIFNSDCTFPADSNAFGMTELFSCSNVNSMSTPMVADIDGDGYPEIIACKHDSQQSPWYSNGFLVFDGRNGTLKQTIYTYQFVNNGQCVTIADIDRDGLAEIYLLNREGFVCSYSNSGTLRWVNSTTVVPYNFLLTAADIMGDSTAEIVCGSYIFNASDGTLLLQGVTQETGRGFAAPNGFNTTNKPYYLYSLCDINNDGKLELCAGNTIYSITITNENGTAGNSWNILRQADVNPAITNYDGQTISIDFDGDGDLDICVIGTSHSISSNNLPGTHTVNTYVWDGQTSTILGYKSQIVNSNYCPSIPSSADLDGNGSPEIAFTIKGVGLIAYSYNPNATSSMSELHHYIPFGETTGLTVFDFNQDNHNEIVFRNDSLLYIVDGSTLTNKCTPVPAFSGTLTEYPVVADVNGDSHAEIIVSRAYLDWSSGNCNGCISVYGSATPGAWSSARKVWNQWAYNSVNINEDLTIPQHLFNIANQFPNGKQPFNTFLCQMPMIDRQGRIFTLAADAAADNATMFWTDDSVSVAVEYHNQGGATLVAPYGITIYKNEYLGAVIMRDSILTNLTDSNLHTLRIPRNIICQLNENDSLVISINDLGNGIAQNGGQQAECDTSNNIITIKTSIFSNSGDTSATACDSFFWWNISYTNSTDTPEHVYTNFTGCDSTVTLNLTVNHSSTYTETVYTCDSLTWHNITYTASTQSPTFTTQNHSGCDSIITLHLTVFQSTVLDESTTICQDQLPYHWGDTILNPDIENDSPSTHNYSSSYTNGHGCDSTIRLSLSVNPTHQATDHQQHCDKYMWQDGITYHTSTNVPQIHLENSYGCDSIVTLDLDIIQSKLTELTDSFCQGTQYQFNGHSYITGGIYSDTLQAENGCDSITKLTLTMLSIPVLHITESHDCETRQYFIHAESNVDYLCWSANGNWNDDWGSVHGRNLIVSTPTPLTLTLFADYTSTPTCSKTTSITLQPIIMPEAIMDVSPEYLTNDNRTIIAKNHSSGEEWVQWFVDGNDFGSEQSISYTCGMNTDSVLITLFANNSLCHDSVSRTVYVRKNTIYAPNAFTPNESTNNTFDILFTGILEYELAIYSRQGLEIYSSVTGSSPWDGTYKGSPCPEGCYVWIVKYRSVVEPQYWHTEKGTVILLR